MPEVLEQQQGTQGGQPSGSDPGQQSGQQQPQGGQQQSQSGQQPGQQQPNSADRNWQELRRNLDDLKTKYEPWEKLNVKPEQVTQFQSTYQKAYNVAAQLGRQLGYPDDEIAEAFHEDPYRTRDFLLNELERMQQGGQRRDGQEDLADLVAQHVEQAIGPIQQRENVRATNEANALFERTVHQAAVESFKAEGIDVSQIPEDEMFMLTSATSEILKYDENALRALKYEGKTAAIQKAFQEARTFLDKYFLARSGRERNRVNPPQNNGQQNNQQPNKRPSLDDILNDPSTIDVAQGRTGANAKYLR